MICTQKAVASRNPSAGSTQQQNRSTVPREGARQAVSGSFTRGHEATLDSFSRGGTRGGAMLDSNRAGSGPSAFAVHPNDAGTTREPVGVFPSTLDPSSLFEGMRAGKDGLGGFGVHPESQEHEGVSAFDTLDPSGLVSRGLSESRDRFGEHGPNDLWGGNRTRSVQGPELAWPRGNPAKDTSHLTGGSVGDSRLMDTGCSAGDVAVTMLGGCVAGAATGAVISAVSVGTGSPSIPVLCAAGAVGTGTWRALECLGEAIASDPGDADEAEDAKDGAEANEDTKTDADEKKEEGQTSSDSGSGSEQGGDSSTGSQGGMSGADGTCQSGQGGNASPGQGTNSTPDPEGGDASNPSTEKLLDMAPAAGAAPSASPSETVSDSVEPTGAGVGNRPIDVPLGIGGTDGRCILNESSGAATGSGGSGGGSSIENEAVDSLRGGDAIDATSHPAGGARS